MKKLQLILAMLILGGTAYAQTDSTQIRMNQNNSGTYPSQKSNTGTNQNNTNTNTYSTTVTDGYRMQNGKVMVTRNGRVTQMDKEMTFSDGSMLRSDGTITRKDGTTLMIKDDEYVDLTGKVMKSNKSKDMYSAPDSAGTNKK